MQMDYLNIGPVPEGAICCVAVRKFSHGGDMYREVRVVYDSNDPAAVDWSSLVEEDSDSLLRTWGSRSLRQLESRIEAARLPMIDDEAVSTDEAFVD